MSVKYIIMCTVLFCLLISILYYYSDLSSAVYKNFLNDNNKRYINDNIPAYVLRRVHSLIAVI